MHIDQSVFLVLLVGSLLVPDTSFLASCNMSTGDKSRRAVKNDGDEAAAASALVVTPAEEPLDAATGWTWNC